MFVAPWCIAKHLPWYTPHRCSRNFARYVLGCTMHSITNSSTLVRQNTFDGGVVLFILCFLLMPSFRSRLGGLRSCTARTKCEIDQYLLWNIWSVYPSLYCHTKLFDTSELRIEWNGIARTSRGSPLALLVIGKTFDATLDHNLLRQYY